MNLNKKWIGIALAVSVVAIAGFLIAVLLSPKAPNYTFDPYVDTYDTVKDYTSQDPNVVFDGVLDDTAWKNQRWLETKHNTEESIGVKMTSYFGTDGLYIAFDVDDYGVFFDEKRDAAYNSGIQLYISSLGGAKNITDHGYEISLTAGGQVKVKKYTGSMYELYLGRVYCETVVKGELNSEEAKGYTLEAYIDYDLFGGDVKQVFANAAIVRAMSETGNERQWYSFGQNDRGAAWTRAETWWTFGQEGLVAYDVAINTGDNGVAEGKNYVPDGDDYSFCIVPNQGYYAQTVKVGTKDVTSQLYYMDGKTYCTVENVKNDLDIQILFAQVTKDTISVAGKVSGTDGVVPGVKLWAVIGGYYQMLTVDADGNYEAQIPAMEGIALFACGEGYVPAAVKAKEGKNDLFLEKMYFGKNEKVERNSTDLALWDLNRLYLDRVRMKASQYSMELVNSEIYGKSIYVSANLKTDVQQGVDTRAGFTFYVNKDLSIFVALTMNGEVNQYNPTGEVNCTIQLITEYKGERIWGSGGIVVPIENQQKIMELASGEGVPVAMHYNKGAIDVWVDGQQIGYGIYAKDKKGNNRLSENTPVAVGLQTWYSRAVYENLKFNSRYPERVNPSAPDWDLSKLNKGIAVSESDKNWSSAILSTKFFDKLSMTAKVPLVGESGQDLRAGFLLKNSQGKEIFVALTANGEKNDNNPNGDLYYTLQVISGGYASWKVDGKIVDIRSWKELHELAADGGVPMTVYMENGKLTVGVNGYVVAENVVPLDKNGRAILEGNTKVAPGLATARTALTFTDVSYGNQPKELKDPSLRQWDTSKAAEGIYSRIREGGFASLLLTEQYASKAGISAKLPLVATAGKDIRAGFVFVNEQGVEVFVSLTANGEKNTNNPNGDLYYTVQVISGGYASWKVEGSIVDVRAWNELQTLAANGGIPVTAYMENGKLTIGVNGYLIAKDVIPITTNGDPILGENTDVKVGLATAALPLSYTEVKLSDVEPALKDIGLRQWDTSKAAEGIYSRIREGGFASLLLTEQYASKAGISAKLPLVATAGKDIRAGFVFVNEQGVEVFVSLTANGEKNTNNPNGDLYYTVQVISGGYASWKVEGSIVDVRAWNELQTLAANGGIPVTAYMENGKLTVGINGYLVAKDVIPVATNGDPILGENTDVKVGLATAALPLSYTEVKLGDVEPALKDIGLRQWDTSKAAEGIYSRIREGGFASLLLTEQYASKAGISAKLPLVATAGKDIRAGFVFVNEQGVEVFVSLTANGEKNTNNPNGDLYYTVQVISGGYASWKVEGSIVDVRAWNELQTLAANGGIPVTAYMENGKLTVGINGYLVAKDVIPVTTNGDPILGENTDVKVGLATAALPLSYTEVKLLETKPDVHVLKVAKKTPASVKIPGDYTDANYAVFEANIKALEAITYDWNSNLVVSVSGDAKWDKYDFQILYGTSASRNLVKLTNNTAGTFDGIVTTQDQNINNPAFEKPFTQEGMDIKVVRLNTWAYLLADMGNGYELVGKMYIPANQATMFSVYNNNTAMEIRNHSVKTGQDAALAALDGIDLKVDQLANAFAVPISGTQWTLEGKVSLENFAATADYRFTVSSNMSEWRRMTIAYIAGQRKWRGQSIAQISGSWASTDIPNANLLTGDGLWTRWVRDGATLSLYVSTDRENWTYVQNCDNCGTNSGVVYIFEANGDQKPMLENMKLRTGVPNS